MYRAPLIAEACTGRMPVLREGTMIVPQQVQGVHRQDACATEAPKMAG